MTPGRTPEVRGGVRSFPAPRGVGRFFDEEVADGAFGEFVAFVEEEDFVEAFGAGAG